MKDMYSFHTSEEDFDSFYENMKGAYKKIYDRIGIGHLTYLTFASGGVFSKYSHEFQTLTPAGEDTIYLDESSSVAVNQEVFTDEILASLNLEKSKLVEHKAIEVGNIFELKTRFSEPLGLIFTDEKGEKHNVLMGCFGIGLGRLLGTVAEVLSDDKGIIWPESIAPFAVHLLLLGEDEDVRREAEKVYENLLKNNIEVLFDDRRNISWENLPMRLLGIPYRAVVSLRSIKEERNKLKTHRRKGKLFL